MIRAILIMAPLMALGACGVDGPPIRPEARTTVTIGTDGVNTSTSVSVEQGPVTVGVRL